MPRGKLPSGSTRGGAEPSSSITDPHDHTKLDAVGKAQGLSAFAADHADRLAHVDLVAEMTDGALQRLHLDRAAIRKQVNALTNNAELVNLYERER